MTVHDILAAALQPDASAFRASLIRQAELHDDQALTTRDPHARRGAESQRNACLAIYDDAASGNIEAMTATLAKLVVALNAAAKLIGLSRAETMAALVAFEGRAQ